MNPDAKWHWYRVEYQARGSIHTYTHGCVKLNNPGICTLVTKAVAAWILLQDNNSERGKNSVLFQEGETARTIVCRLAYNMQHGMALPDDFWRSPDPHPCAVTIDQVTDCERDYCDLVNTSPAYCL